MNFKDSRRKWKSLLSLLLTIALTFQLAMPAFAVEATVSVLDGLLTILDSEKTAVSTQDDVVTITVTGFSGSAWDNPITLTSNADYKAELKFDYRIENASAYTGFDSSSGTYTATIEAGAEIKLNIEAPAQTTATLTMSNFSLTAVSDSANVTINYDSNLGSVTVNNETVASGGVIEGVGTSGVTLTAVPNAGATFVGWVDENGTSLSSEATYTHNPTGDITLTAVFTTAAAAPWFKVGNYTTQDLADAITKAQSTGKTIVLTSSGTLAANTTYTIPSGVKLLIPYNDAYTENFNEKPGTSTDTPGSSQHAYATLTLGAGTVINCQGQICVNGQVEGTSGSYTGVPTGPYGHINLSSETSQIVLDGGTMYCYGYITGAGDVIANSGTVYEVFQLLGWKGGSAAAAWYLNGTVKSFPVNDYAVQNIEADFTVNSGATAKGVVSITVGDDLRKQIAVEYISTNAGLVQLGSGASVRRDFNAEENRMCYTLSGTAAIGSVNITIQFSGLEAMAAQLAIGTKKITMNSADHILAIPYYMDFVAASGSTVTLSNDYKLLPGATLTVEGATAEKAAAKAIVKGNLYIYDTADYVGKGYVSGNSIPVRYIASTGAKAGSLPKMNSSSPSGQVIVNGTLQIDGAMYTTENGGTSVDKVIKGNGTILNNSSATAAVNNVLDEYKYQNSEIVDCNINVIPVVGQLTGISTENSYNSLSAGTYTGMDNGWWYQNTVAFSGDVSALKAYNGSVISINNGSATGYSCNGGTLQFTLPFTYSASCTGAELTQAAAPGSAVMAYSVPVTGAGISVTVAKGSAAANNATIKYISKADSSVVATQECYIPEGTDVSAYYADEACTTKATTFANGDTLYILVEAKVGENAYYASFEEAVKNAVKPGDKIMLLSDVQVASPVKVAAEQDIDINLAGKALTYSSNALNIYGTVDLDLNGGSIFNAQGAEVSALVVRDGGKLNLNMNGGKMTWSDYGVEGYSFATTSPTALVHCYSGGTANIDIAEGETISVEHPNAVTAYALHAVINEGSMSINGAGTITTDAYTNTTGAYVNAGNNTYNAAPPVVNSGSLTVQGTTVASTNTNGSKNYTILNYDGGKLTLDGANVSCASGYAVYNWGGTIDSIKDTMIVGTNGICNYNMDGYSYTATITEIVGATTIQGKGGHALSTHPETYVGIIGGEGSTVELIASANGINGNEGYIKELGGGLTIIAGGYGVYTKGIVEKVSTGGYYKTGNSVFRADVGTEQTPYNASIGIPEGYQLSVMAQMRTLRNGKVYGCCYLTTEKQNYPQILAGHLQALPEITCQGPDLWQALTPEDGYFGANGWDSTGQPTVDSITIPVQPGDRISASSFGTTLKSDGTSSAGIRVTWFDENGIMDSWSPSTTYTKNSNGYVTVPEGAIAVCIPVWVGDADTNWAKVVKEHEYDFKDEDSDGFYTAVCTMCGNAHDALGEHLQIMKDEYCAGTNLWVTLNPELNRRTATAWSSDYYSITIPVKAGDKVWANSFQAKGANDHTADGIRVTWFLNNGNTPSSDAKTVYNNFIGNTDEVTGLNYLVAPDGAIAVCVPMWKNNTNSSVRILNAPHDYEDVVTAPGCAQGYTTHTCSICGDSYVDSYTDGTGEHKFTNYVSNGDATAEADGTKTAVCDYGCGAESTITDEGSSNVYKALKGKVISIMGDSISTMEGYIPTADGFNLEHYARYVLEAEEGSSFIEFDPNETWWMQVINTFGAKLGINESWRSTEIGNIFDVEVNSGYEGTKACMASMTRIQNLGSNGIPDLILFYGGTNDITQRKNGRVLGEFAESMVPATVDLTTDKWDTVIEAYVTALMRMHHFYPEARIVCMFPTVTGNNSKDVVSTYNAEFKEVCDYFIAKGYDIVYLDLLDSGITTAHHVDGTHPNEEGMDLITAMVNKTLVQTCGDLTVGEHTVYSVSHELTNAKASRSYYKGASNGKSFVETVTGENLTVTVKEGTENPKDITETVVTYNADKSEAYINVAEVTDALTITAEGKSIGQYLAPYLQQLPENVYNTTNLWTMLNHNAKYYKTTVNDTRTAYDAATWDTNGNVCSVTVPVGSGYRIYATSLADSRGIRTTWFFADETFISWAPVAAHAKFMANTDEKSGKHYILAPEGAIAVNVAMWDDSAANELYILNLPDDPLTMNGLPDHLVDLPDPCYNDTNIWAELAAAGKLDGTYWNGSTWGTTGTAKSVTVRVNPGDRIVARSFGTTSGGNGIRVSWFLADGSVSSIPKADVYTEFNKNGYLTAPENAVAVCVPVWVADESCTFYNLDLPDNPLKKHNLLDHLVDLPDPCYNDTNIWAELAAADKLDGTYWNGSTWGTTGQAKSVTVRVKPGDKLKATSFGNSEDNQGIRVTWFFADGSTPKSMAKGDVYAEYTANGYLRAPENAIAVCVPMWVARDTSEFYNLSLPARPASEIANYNGKVISIMGDSISTFEGYIPVKDGFNLAHRKRYPDTGNNGQYNDVTTVEQTWWHQAISELGAKLGINDSWAGSTVANFLDVNSGDKGPDAAMASMTRIQNLGANGTPDVILVFGGTNDGTGSLGTFDASTAPTPDNVSLTDYKWDTVAESYAVMLARMQHFYPDAKIVAILPYDNEAPTTNPVFEKICEHYGVPYTNLYTETDIRINGGYNEVIYDGIHPTAKTMDVITDAVLGVLLNEVEMTAGENVVYPITHTLSNVDASKHYYKGVSANVKFEETISSMKAADVTVVMGNEDVTATYYNAENGVLSIDSVTGAIEITATASKTNSDHVQSLPDPAYRDTNLWAKLEPENAYYAENGWKEGLYSITFPVTGGDKIWSTSLCDSTVNGNSQDGICITWFKGDEVLKRLSRTEADAEFKQNGFVTAPEGATAVNVPTWTTSINNVVYNLSLPTIYDGHLIELNREAICSGTDIWDLLQDGWAEVYLDSSGKWTIMEGLRSITIPVQQGDVIWANVFGTTTKTDGTSKNGIRITWLDGNGIQKTDYIGASYGNLSAEGTVTVPEGAVAVNLPVWDYQIENDMYIRNLGHKMMGITAKSATCTAEGNSAYWYCTSCDTYFSDAEGMIEIEKDSWILPKLEHSYTGEWEITDAGHAQKCESGCGEANPEVEAHLDETEKDHKCDICEYVMSNCEGSEQTTTYTHVENTETHTVTVTCNVCGQQVGEVTTENCADGDDADKLCDKCGDVIEKDQEEVIRTVVLDILSKESENVPQITVREGTTTGENWNNDGELIVGANVDFAVTYYTGCVVFACVTDEVGKVIYERLPAIATEDNMTCIFTTESKENMTIYVAIKGDLNSDGVLNSRDAFQIQRAEVGLRSMTDIQNTVSDVNNNGTVDSRDAFQVQRAEVGLRVFDWK